MNDAARDALVSAAMNGTRQIIGRLTDNAGGVCAIGAMQRAGVWPWQLHWAQVDKCPFCGATETWTGAREKKFGQIIPIANENDLVIHLNNDHEWDFLTIARKLGNDGE